MSEAKRGWQFGLPEKDQPDGAYLPVRHSGKDKIMDTNKKQVISGQDLIDAGYKQGNWFRLAMDAANDVLREGGSWDEGMAAVQPFVPGPSIPLKAEGETPFFLNIDIEDEAERDNVERVKATMDVLMRTPVIKYGAVMPDACPAGPLGTIPVGGVVASEGIHPGMHSADICCSMATSVYPGVSPKALLDAVHHVTHFGPGGRERGKQHLPPDELVKRFEANSLLRNGLSGMRDHFATQGDGNHFAYVGTMKSSGETVLVTHHGSRGPGARLYDKGMKLAEQHRHDVSPETLSQNAWIKADTADGELYWDALQAMRLWTKANHYHIHDLAAEVVSAKVADRFWNEHNFVFRKSDGLFYHGKGATPAFDGWAEDATDLTIIPLNMAEPILIVRGSNAKHGLGFSPHGAGRNFSRTRHIANLGGREVADVFAEETKGLDARFFSGTVDVSELPSAYKNAASVRRQIESYKLAAVVDEVLPFGTIMAGDWQADAPWRRRKLEKRAARAEVKQ
jgi:tRNA-splicing ligase RtcB (3'-phosphate/5'-hydroxy nucleic acid ligase)